jgi:hypothetical protein
MRSKSSFPSHPLGLFLRKLHVNHFSFLSNIATARLGLVLGLASLLVVGGCSSTQKTGGQGMVSVVAQNVVRIAGAKAMRDLQLTELKGKKANVQTTGFVDEFNKGFIQNIMHSHIEASGATLVDRSNAEFVVDVAVNAAGNDNGRSGYVVGSAERTEGSVDLTITVRNAATGARLSSQNIRGYAKYQQGSFLGISGAGAYFVKMGDNWVLVEDPARFM